MIIVEKQSGVWTQIGSDITAPFTAITGSCLTGDGTKVFGSLASPANWTQLGADIDGEAASDQSGYSVSMSSDGTRVAIGASSNDGNGAPPVTCACTRRAVESWTQVGTISTARLRATRSGSRYRCPRTARAWRSALLERRHTARRRPRARVRRERRDVDPGGLDIDGEAAGDHSGYSVSMSSDGTRVAIGAPSTTAPAQRRPRARVRGERRDVDPGGLDIDGEAADDRPGSRYRCPRTARAWRSARMKRRATATRGHVRVYAESGGTWTQVGSDIDGEAAGDQSGYSVSMSSDGTRVAIGASGNDGNGTDAGHVRVYAESGGTWTQVGSDIDGEAAGDQSGWSVSMSSDGTRVAIGAPSNDGNGTTPATCACTLRAAGRGPRLAPTSTARLRATVRVSVSMSSDGTRVAIGSP